MAQIEKEKLVEDQRQIEEARAHAAEEACLEAIAKQERDAAAAAAAEKLRLELEAAEQER